MAQGYKCIHQEDVTIVNRGAFKNSFKIKTDKNKINQTKE